jgi:hypothetical protein
MSRLLLLLYTLIGPTLAGCGVLVVLTLGVFDARAILLAAAAGFALGVPCSWAVMRQLTRHSGE